MGKGDSTSRMLLLMRHGKAMSDAASDHARELTDRGRDQACLIGDYLRSQGVVPDAALVSSAERAQQTWSAVADRLGAEPEDVRTVDDIYEAGPAELLDIIHGIDSSARIVMVVGHEPTISALSHWLASEESDSGSVAQARIGMPTGGLAVLSGSLKKWKDLSEDALDLLTIVRP